MAFKAALAEQILVAHAGAGGKTEAFVRQVLTWGKPIWAMDDTANQHLIRWGAGMLEKCAAFTRLRL